MCVVLPSQTLAYQEGETQHALHRKNPYDPMDKVRTFLTSFFPSPPEDRVIDLGHINGKTVG